MNSTITEEMEKAITSKEKHLEEKICKTLFKTTDTNYHLHQQMTDASACVQVRVRASACLCVCVCVNLSSLGETTSCKTDSDVDV